MTPNMRASLARLQEHFQADPRCLGLYLYGAVGDGSADDYSDIDAAVVVGADAYPGLKRDLRGVCERVLGPVLVWWFKAERPGCCDYACLIEDGGDLLAFDLSLNTPPALADIPRSFTTVLFDPAGLLQEPASPPAPPPLSHADVLRAMGEYWVFMALNGKYARRGDTYKLLYVQQRLFQAHLRLLNTLHPDTRWLWWARDVQRLPAAQREELMVYFGAASAEAAVAALDAEIALFARDARAACARWGLDYREEVAAGVRRHLAAMGALVS